MNAATERCRALNASSTRSDHRNSHAPGLLVGLRNIRAFGRLAASGAMGILPERGRHAEALITTRRPHRLHPGHIFYNYSCRGTKPYRAGKLHERPVPSSPRSVRCSGAARAL
jgi:hypothetical protein